jgi:threonine synthase
MCDIDICLHGLVGCSKSATGTGGHAVTQALYQQQTPLFQTSPKKTTQKISFLFFFFFPIYLKIQVVVFGDGVPNLFKLHVHINKVGHKKKFFF